MVLGDGARDRGAPADLISTDPPTGAGVAFVRLEADPDPVRVRAAWVSDADIRAMAASAPPRRRRACAIEAGVPHEHPRNAGAPMTRARSAAPACTPPTTDRQSSPRTARCAAGRPPGRAPEVTHDRTRPDLTLTRGPVRVRPPLAREVARDLADRPRRLHPPGPAPPHQPRHRRGRAGHDPLRAHPGLRLPACAERAKSLRAEQCREGWHLEDEPDLTRADPDDTQQMLAQQTRRGPGRPRPRRGRGRGHRRG